ncbi:hypothetical protein FACS1894172_18910 [Spirochaetia bacterium]|nr:hypothetical protein FACS1894164_18800 [Spirochaetia bacterium]GHU36231.1 hypothetical protein FACS1894172_18910 [Spirochaetia bacterium]
MENEQVTVLAEREMLSKKFRIYGTPEEPLFLAKDVAEWLGYSENNITNFVSAVDEDEKLKLTMVISGQSRQYLFLTEDGMYEVIMLSRKPVAKPIKKKIKKILKEIRMTGSYSINAAPYARDPSYQIMNPVERAKKWIAETEYTITLEKKVEQLAPKADEFDAWMSSGENAGIREALNTLGVPERKCIEWALGRIFYRSQPRDRDGHCGQLVAYASLQKAGYFVVRPFYNKNGYNGFRTMVTPTGMVFLRDQWTRAVEVGFDMYADEEV